MLLHKSVLSLLYEHYFYFKIYVCESTSMCLCAAVYICHGHTGQKVSMPPSISLYLLLYRQAFTQNVGLTFFILGLKS